MKALSFSLLATLSALALSGCASTRDRMGSTDVAPPLTFEQAYITKVERMAARRGLKVIWVNPPQSQADRMVAAR